MAKYSTGDSNSSEDDSCQLCGETDAPLTTADIEGATVSVCKDCEPDDAHRDDKVNSKQTSRDDSTQDNKPKMGNTPGYTLSQPNPDWVGDVSYGNTATPYMKTNYTEIFEQALDDHEITKEQLSEVTEVPIESIEALENGNAVDHGVGEKEIEAIETVLEITLAEN